MKKKVIKKPVKKPVDAKRSKAAPSSVLDHRLTKELPYHSERLYALIRGDGAGGTQMFYTMSNTQLDLWASVSDLLGTGHNKESLMAMGWRPRMVFVQEEGR